MKKVITLAIGTAVLLSSCGTTTGSGAYVGATFGSILGSAIGGISGGPRGSDLGTIIGMAGGAAVGAVVANEAEKAQQQKYEEHRAARLSQQQSGYQQYGSQQQNYRIDDCDDSGFDPNGMGDDVIHDFDMPAADNGSYSVATPRTETAQQRTASSYTSVDSSRPALEVRNARFVDANQDNAIQAGELCKVVMEVYNNSSETIYDVQPVVMETTGNKRLYVSDVIHVEKIAAGKGIRYTAMVKADRKLKDGTAHFSVYARQGRGGITSPVTYFDVRTKKM